MILQKWNYEKHKYEPYEIPNEWRVSCYEPNMKKIVNCCQCGKEVLYGETFTSHEVHTIHGFGYSVCEECYEKENEKWLEAHKGE